MCTYIICKLILHILTLIIDKQLFGFVIIITIRNFVKKKKTEQEKELMGRNSLGYSGPSVWVYNKPTIRT